MAGLLESGGYHFRNEDNGFSVIEVREETIIVTAVGGFPFISQGTNPPGEEWTTIGLRPQLKMLNYA